ncbi:MAG TPA: response regulator [Candidatus Omnitrophota bacterium]|nr:response regulator [Candidatus Omnitrophota bacterium]HNQ49815.1 response regulator [Candidatus Omnitrophota bacterium]HQO38385.1 response regulator [Candidatus Omnitrophota bacterium]HQQ05556.1 response regulator [Candidatus Omnitrophota bacterium]
MAGNKILVVDDEVDVRDILSKKLTENGYAVRVVSSGKDVLEQCKAECPDLVLLDIVLSDTDGYSVAEELRRDKSIPRIPIIFMTGQDLDVPEMARNSARFGVCDFITKPCAFADVLEKIRLFI